MTWNEAVVVAIVVILLLTAYLSGYEDGKRHGRAQALRYVDRLLAAVKRGELSTGKKCEVGQDWATNAPIEESWE